MIKVYVNHKDNFIKAFDGEREISANEFTQITGILIPNSTGYTMRYLLSKFTQESNIRTDLWEVDRS